jgi:glutathione S-transferase
MLYFSAVQERARSLLKLIATTTSPYGRKVRIALAEKKFEYQLDEISPWTADNPVHAWNPLGKVPVLVLDDGTHLYDSRVIVEYLDTVSPVSRLIPEPARQRIVVRRIEALADGINDAAIAIVLEGRRPQELRSSDWVARQRMKIESGVGELSRELGDKQWCNGEGYSLADIAAGCALGYLAFRENELSWRHDFANLSKLSERLAKRAAFAETVPA